MIKQVIRETKDSYTNLLAMNFGELSDFLEDYNPDYETDLIRGQDGELSQRPASAKERNSKFHGDKEFGENLESAKRLLTRGYQPEAMKGAFSGFDTAFEAHEEVTRMAEEGYAFDVPSILSGEDEVWFQRKNVGNAPSIHIVFEGGANAGVNAMNFYIQSAVVNKLAEILSEEAHIRVSATYSAERQGYDFKDGDKRQVDNITYVSMKDYDEPIDLRRLGAVAHPSFFRRLMFSIFENGNTEFFGKHFGISRGYGSQNTTSGLGMTEDLENDLFESDIVVHIPSPSEWHFENVDNAIKFCKWKLEEVNAMKVAQ